MLEKQDVQWTRITPSGVFRSKKNFSQWKKEIHKNISQLSHMVGFQKKRTGFGQSLGNFWLILDPLLHTALYFFIVTVISGSGDIERLLKIAVAVTFWRYHSRIIGQSVNLFRNNIALLSQIYFPLHLILMEFVAVNIMFFAYSLAGPVVLLLLNGYWPDIYWLWLIPLFLLQTMFSFTIGIYLSIVGTFFRDISGVLFFPLAIWWYISPGMYDVDKVPEAYRWIFDLNPFSYFFTGYHGALLNDQGPDIRALAVLFLGSTFALLVGLKLLSNARYYFFKYL